MSLLLHFVLNTILRVSVHLSIMPLYPCLKLKDLFKRSLFHETIPNLLTHFIRNEEGEFHLVSFYLSSRHCARRFARIVSFSFTTIL